MNKTIRPPSDVPRHFQFSATTIHTIHKADSERKLPSHGGLCSSPGTAVARYQIVFNLFCR